MDLREKIKAADDISRQRVKVPKWDVEVEVRSMTGAQRAKLLQQTVGEDKKPIFDKLYPKLLIHTIYNPKTGKPIFNETDEKWLMEKNSGPIETLITIAMRVSGLTEDSLEEIEKNFGSGIPNEDSISD